MLSSNGKWVAYTLLTGERSAELVVRSTQERTEYRVLQGVLPRREFVLSTPFENSGGSQISADAGHLVFAIVAAERDENALTSLPVDLGLMRLADGRVDRWSAVSERKFSPKTGRYLAALQEQAMAANGTAGKREPRTLLLRDFRSGTFAQIHGVKQYLFDPQDRYVAYVRASGNPQQNGVFVRFLPEGNENGLFSGVGDYGDLSVDHAGEQLAFTFDRAQGCPSGHCVGIYYSKSPHHPAEAIVTSADLKERTPLLMMHGEEDAAVPLSQGTEFFFALQRNDKPAWFVRYPDEGHVLGKYAHRLDWDRCLLEFFDHYLKDAPMSQWMKDPADEQASVISAFR